MPGPSATHEHCHDDRQGDEEYAHKRRSPERPRPAEQSPQRVCDVLVVPRSRLRDGRGQPEGDRSREQEDRVDRAPVAAPGLAIGQQDGDPGSSADIVSLLLA